MHVCKTRVEAKVHVQSTVCAAVFVPSAALMEVDF